MEERGASKCSERVEVILNLSLNYCVPRASPFSSLYLTRPHKTDLILAAVGGSSIFMKNYNFSEKKRYH